MHGDEQRSNRPRTGALHPVVYRINAALLLWMVLAAWGFAGRHGGYIGLALAVVSGLVAITVLIPFVLWRIWRACRPAAQRSEPAPGSFHDWLLGDLETWQGRLKGADAAVQAILPLAAGAIGMTAFAIVKHLAMIGGAS